MTNSQNRLLVIDDDRGILSIIEDVAEDNGYQVSCADNAEDFRQLLASFNPSLIFIDLIIPGTDGVDLLRELADAHFDARIVLMSGLNDKVLSTARQLGESQGLDMLDVLVKPIDINSLEDRLRQGVR